MTWTCYLAHRVDFTIACWIVLGLLILLNELEFGWQFEALITGLISYAGYCRMVLLFKLFVHIFPKRTSKRSRWEEDGTAKEITWGRCIFSVSFTNRWWLYVLKFMDLYPRRKKMAVDSLAHVLVTSKNCFITS